MVGSQICMLTMNVLIQLEVLVTPERVDNAIAALGRISEDGTTYTADEFTEWLCCEYREEFQDVLLG